MRFKGNPRFKLSGTPKRFHLPKRMSGKRYRALKGYLEKWDMPSEDGHQEDWQGLVCSPSQDGGADRQTNCIIAKGRIQDLQTSPGTA